MKGIRMCNIEGINVPVPTPINIAELVSERQFNGRLLHFTEQQWKLTLERLDPLEITSEKAVRMTVFKLTSGAGFLGAVAQECAPPDCEEVSSRKQVYAGLFESGFGPDRDYWFQPCYCKEEIDDGGVDTKAGETPAGAGICEFQFVPVRVNLAGRIITLMLFRCYSPDGRCRNCQFGYSVSPTGVYQLACQCSLL